eukprot:gene9278-6523_t
MFQISLSIYIYIYIYISFLASSSLCARRAGARDTEIDVGSHSERRAVFYIVENWAKKGNLLSSGRMAPAECERKRLNSSFILFGDDGASPPSGTIAPNKLSQRDSRGKKKGKKKASTTTITNSSLLKGVCVVHRFLSLSLCSWKFNRSFIVVLCRYDYIYIYIYVSFFHIYIYIYIYITVCVCVFLLFSCCYFSRHSFRAAPSLRLCHPPPVARVYRAIIYLNFNSCKGRNGAEERLSRCLTLNSRLQLAGDSRQTQKSSAVRERVHPCGTACTTILHGNMSTEKKKKKKKKKFERRGLRVVAMGNEPEAVTVCAVCDTHSTSLFFLNYYWCWNSLFIGILYLLLVNVKREREREREGRVDVFERGSIRTTTTTTNNKGDSVSFIFPCSRTQTNKQTNENNIHINTSSPVACSGNGLRWRTRVEGANTLCKDLLFCEDLYYCFVELLLFFPPLIASTKQKKIKNRIVPSSCSGTYSSPSAPSVYGRKSPPLSLHHFFSGQQRLRLEVEYQIIDPEETALSANLNMYPWAQPSSAVEREFAAAWSRRSLSTGDLCKTHPEDPVREQGPSPSSSGTSIPVPHILADLQRRLEQRRVAGLAEPRDEMPWHLLLLDSAEAEARLPQPPAPLIERLYGRSDHRDSAETKGVKRPRSAAAAPAAPAAPQAEAEEEGAWRHEAPHMAFAEGFEPIDHMGRPFTEPLPAARQAVASRQHDPCALPRAPRRVLRPDTRTGSKGGKPEAGIQLLRWAPPDFGHLLFSADLRGVVRLWRFQGQGVLPWDKAGGRGAGGGAAPVIATYRAHHQPVKSLQVTADARRMSTGSTDGTIAMWDVETGECLHHLFTNEPAPGNAFLPVADHLLHPSDPHNILLAAVDRKLFLYDVRVGSSHRLREPHELAPGAAAYECYRPQREYSGHMGTILHVSLLGSTGSKLLTTSEDKTLRTWDYSIPIQIKQFADAKMPAISHVIRHPQQDDLLAAQSQDNKVMVFQDEGGGQLRRWQHREFTGHKIVGTRCQLSFSRDGQYLSSGDVSGRLYIWRWATGELVRQFQAHHDMLTSHLWHPAEPSRVVTAGWDGMIKEWV